MFFKYRGPAFLIVFTVNYLGGYFFFFFLILIFLIPKFECIVFQLQININNW